MKIQNKKLNGIVATVMLVLAAAVGSVSMAAGKAEAEREIKTEYEHEIEAIASGETICEIPALVTADTKNTVRQAKKDYEEKVRKEKLEEERRREEQQKEEQQKEEQEASTPPEQELLAALIFCEAGNQPYEGQVAVGAVVMNRVRSGVYPNSISEVIYQSGQFTPAMTGWLDSVLASDGYTNSAMQAAADALAGSNPIGDMLYFDCGGYGYRIRGSLFPLIFRESKLLQHNIYRNTITRILWPFLQPQCLL